MDNSWSLLPELVLNLITQNLCLPDLYRFAAVCKPWRSFSVSLKLQTHLPWLIVPHSLISSNTSRAFTTEHSSAAFFSLSCSKIYKAEIPQLANRRICASFPGGWLMTVHENSQIQLFNPFYTTQKSVIHLPPLTTFPRVLGRLKRNDNKQGYIVLSSDSSRKYSFSSLEMRNVYISKAAMSSALVKDGTVIMVIQGMAGMMQHEGSTLVYYRFGGKEKRWIQASPYDEHFHFHDVSYYNGKFYAVRQNGFVFVIHGVVEEEVQPFPYVEDFLYQHPGKVAGQYYILESSGELLVVLRFFVELRDIVWKPDGIHDSLVIKTVGFKVFRIEFGMPNSWVEVANIGNRSLFVGNNSSFSILSSDFAGCKSNCIYFTGDHLSRLRDLGIFNLEDGSIETIPYSTDILLAIPPIWFAPFQSY